MKKLLLPMIVLLTLAGGHARAQCNALFSYWISSVIPPTVSFMDSSSFTGTTSFQWNFGDGSAINTQQNPVHTFPANGFYTVCLTITDSTGCTDSICNLVDITSPPPSFNLSYFDVDSANLYSCSSPAAVIFYLYAQTSGFAPADSFLFEVKYGDGVDSSFYLLSSNGYIQQQLSHIYLNGGTYVSQIIMTAPTLPSDTLYASAIQVASNCGTITGTVYNDLNGNCTFDTGEELSNIPLYIYSGTVIRGWTTSNANGSYAFNVPTGSPYDIHVNAGTGLTGHFVPTCPASGILTVGTVPSTGNNIGVACPQGYDLQGNISGWGFRPGFTATICVSAYNQRCTSPSGQIEVILPTNFTPLPDSSGTAGYVVNGNTVTYAIDSSSLYWSFCVYVAVSPNAFIGDTVCIDLNITPVIGDSVPSNNSGTFCFVVRNSWDPNDKYAEPMGVGPQGYILPNTDLTYTIRFQNTGNADAINIYILDTLNANLDASSVELIGMSHNSTMSLQMGNVLRFDMNNINLPDSNVNEPASHGYVTYRIKQVSNIAHMAQITNTAGIYFDFNPAVITNTTMHTIDMFLSVKPIQNNTLNAVLYPNPANGKCFVSFDDSQLKTISVSDAIGKEVYRSRIAANSFVLNTENFSEGIYVIRITDNLNRTNISKLLISH